MNKNVAEARRLIEIAVEEAKTAEFVAIDLEMTGLLEEKDRRPSFASLLKDSIQSAPNFLVVQLGFCVARRLSKDDPHMWTLSPYNFYVFPSKKTVFKSDVKSIKFLHDAGFDFNRWITEGQNYERLTAIQYAEKSTLKNLVSKEVVQHGLQRLIDTIIENDIPVVLHNGMLDMLHIYDKFVGAIASVQEPDDSVSPDSAIGKFCQDWLRLFRGGVFDTKHIASTCQYSLLGIADGQSTALEPLRSHLIKSELHSQFEIASHLAPSGYLLQTLDDEASSFNHEAGFDAMVTAQVFVMELELLSARNKPPVKLTPSQKEAATTNTAGNSFLAIGHDWKNHQNYEKFKNVVALYSVSPDNLRLENYLPKEAAVVIDETHPTKRQKTAKIPSETIN